MSLFTPKTSPYNNYYDNGRYILAWRLSTALTFILFPFILIFFITGEREISTTYAIAFIIALSVRILLQKTKKYKIVFYVFSILGTALIHLATNIVVQGVHFSDFLWMATIIMLSFFGLGKKAGFVFLGVNSVGVIYFIFTNLNNNTRLLNKQYDFFGKTIISFEVIIALFCIAYIVQQFISFQKYSEEKLLEANHHLEEQNQLVEAQNEEKTVLMKEIHHRVKNNLQIIISLLRMQSSDIKTKEAQDQFNEAIKRIMTMSLIHQKLYQENELSKINLNDYTTDLFNEIKSIYNIGKQITLSCDCKNFKIYLKTIVPLGLILNELISNSFKYAFTDKSEGIVTLNFCELENDFFQVSYSDNGSWIENKEKSRTNGFGLELVSILTEQLDGTVSRVTDDKGTHFEFNLKNLEN